MRKKHPSRQDCLRLLEEYKTPEHVVKHCKAVADTAVKMGKALNEHGYHLDLELIEAAGLIHDIARVEDEHWEKGYELAKSLGYEQEADIIKVHMRYSPFSAVEHINETDLVCLGDRIVKEDAYVGLDKRMEYIIEKARKQGHADAEKRILEKKKEAQALIEGIENTIGMTLDQLMKGI
ncbi:HD domain-containing protein [Hominibacterium faecale]|uniref:HD domain-containing protein n=1 Tax=Hominibacterium faecale TaxID=2839743 RepID=UPI0022B2AA49|nr:HD domain-containing protein [Hominibacterium faecale]